MKHKERGNFRPEHTFLYVRTEIAERRGDSPEIAATNNPEHATIFPDEGFAIPLASSPCGESGLPAGYSTRMVQTVIPSLGNSRLRAAISSSSVATTSSSW